MIRNNKGFSLVELLATVTILGILSSLAIVGVSKLIDKSKSNADEQQKNMLKLAAESYFQDQDHRSLLPRTNDDTAIVEVEELKSKGYLKEDVKNSEKKNCNNSKVKVTLNNKSDGINGKKTYNKYIYEVIWNCE